MSGVSALRNKFEQQQQQESSAPSQLTNETHPKLVAAGKPTVASKPKPGAPENHVQSGVRPVPKTATSGVRSAAKLPEKVISPGTSSDTHRWAARNGLGPPPSVPSRQPHDNSHITSSPPVRQHPQNATSSQPAMHQLPGQGAKSNFGVSPITPSSQRPNLSASKPQGPPRLPSRGDSGLPVKSSTSQEQSSPSGNHQERKTSVQEIQAKLGGTIMQSFNSPPCHIPKSSNPRLPNPVPEVASKDNRHRRLPFISPRTSSPVKPKRPPAVSLDSYSVSAAPPRASLARSDRASAAVSLIKEMTEEEEDQFQQDFYDEIPQPQPPPKSVMRNGNDSDDASDDGDSDFGEEFYMNVDSSDKRPSQFEPPKINNAYITGPAGRYSLARPTSRSSLQSQSTDDSKSEKEKQKDAKRQREKEEKLKKKFNLIGDEKPIQSGKVLVDCKETKLDLGAKKDETVHVLRMHDNPTGKWLVQNDLGDIGYLDIQNIELDYLLIRQSTRSMSDVLQHQPQETELYEIL